jgi:hypothetical protein
MQMRRETAEKLIAAMRKMDILLEELGKISHEIEDDEERKQMRGEIADLIHESHIGITLKIVKQFPDLHPDRDS